MVTFITHLALWPTIHTVVNGDTWWLCYNITTSALRLLSTFVVKLPKMWHHDGQHLKKPKETVVQHSTEVTVVMTNHSTIFNHGYTETKVNIMLLALSRFFHMVHDNRKYRSKRANNFPTNVWLCIGNGKYGRSIHYLTWQKYECDVGNACCPKNLVLGEITHLGFSNSLPLVLPPVWFTSYIPVQRFKKKMLTLH